VRATVRNSSNSVIADERVVLDTPGERADWSEAVEDVDAVIHLAARAHRSPAAQRAERELYELVNVTNTVNLACAAADAGASHFVFLSSIAVNGATTGGRPRFCEDDPPSPRTVYAETKLKAETMLADFADARGVRLTTIRTPLIYGRDARGSLGLLVRLLKSGIPLPLAGIQNRRSFASAVNVADFIVHWLRQPGESGTFLVADDEQISTTEFVRLLAHAVDSRPRLFRVPSSLMKASLTLAGRAYIAESVLQSLEVDTSKARATGWRPASIGNMAALFR
jgi:UDP-glucose 4-epimerase